MWHDRNFNGSIQDKNMLAGVACQDKHWKTENHMLHAIIMSTARGSSVFLSSYGNMIFNQSVRTYT